MGVKPDRILEYSCGELAPLSLNAIGVECSCISDVQVIDFGLLWFSPEAGSFVFFHTLWLSQPTKLTIIVRGFIHFTCV